MDFETLNTELQKTLTEFRGYVDRELKEIKANGVASPETKETLAKLNQRIDELQAKAERPAPKTEKAEKSEYAKAFEKFARKGDVSAVEKAAGDAMNVDSNSGADGGVAVPEELDRTIYSLMLNASPMRSVCNVIQVSGNYSKVVNKHGATSGWVGEADTRGATKTPQFAELTPTMGEIYANAPATQKVLDDAFFNVEQFLASELAAKFAIEEDVAFVSGDGSNKPIGILAGTTAATADGTRAFGSIQHVAAGAAGDWGSGVKPFDVLTDLITAMKEGHRNGAKFMTNKAMVGELRKLKDGNGLYLWQPSVTAGQPSTILGYPLVENENIAAKASNSLSIVFANFPKAYYIVDRIGIRVLRDPYTNKPYVMFYATKRVGGMLVDSEAIKVVKFAAS